VFFYNVHLPSLYAASPVVHMCCIDYMVCFICSADVEAVDIGDYKCASGYIGEVKNDSNTVELLVNPGKLECPHLYPQYYTHIYTHSSTYSCIHSSAHISTHSISTH